jgi:hypothetical protein
MPVNKNRLAIFESPSTTTLQAIGAGMPEWPIKNGHHFWCSFGNNQNSKVLGQTGQV